MNMNSKVNDLDQSQIAIRDDAEYPFQTMSGMVGCVRNFKAGEFECAMSMTLLEGLKRTRSCTPLASIVHHPKS